MSAFNRGVLMICRIGILLELAILCAACSNDLEWTEDVRLPSGEVVTLKRSAEFKGGSSWLGDPSTESKQAFEFKNPRNGERVKWSNELASGRLSTIAIWLDGAVPQLLTEPSYGGDFMKYGCPNPPYLLFEYRSGRWDPKPLSQISVKQVRSNMTSRVLGAKDKVIRAKYRLDVRETSDSYTYEGTHRVPYSIRFEGMPVQTFVKYANCDKPLDHLLEKEPGK